MKRSALALAVLSVVGIAAWAYDVNYRTKEVLGEIDRLRGQISGEREALQVLRVEWAYLNAPERLTRLVARHEAALGLVPMAPERFGHVAEVPYPPQAAPDPLSVAISAAVSAVLASREAEREAASDPAGRKTLPPVRPSPGVRND
ncbi:MAG: cell division protein FtsL [Pseudomonadota bacterium]